MTVIDNPCVRATSAFPNECLDFQGEGDRGHAVLARNARTLARGEAVDEVPEFQHERFSSVLEEGDLSYTGLAVKGSFC